LKKNLIDQNHASIITDLKSDKRSFQAFAVVIIIIESMSSKQENIKLALNRENADDFQISMKTSQHLIVDVIKLTFEFIFEFTFELTLKLTPELNT
jgi:hypothetical protein